MINQVQLVAKMREYLERHQMKRYELAIKLKTTPSNITRWLSGKKISPAWVELIEQRLELK